MSTTELTMQAPSRQDLVGRARDLAPLISAAADRTEAEGFMPEDIVALLADAELFWVLLPEELGGSGADPLTAMEVVEEVTRADGSVGWSLMANMSVTGYFGGHCGEAAAEALFGGSERAIIAGMFAPMGVAEATTGGYLVKGNYSFGSGVGNASWIGGGARIEEDGAPVELIFVVPRESVVFKGNWEVLGLTGTGSIDYEVPEQFVPSDFTVRRVGGVARRGQAAQRLGLQVYGAAGHAGVAMGLGKRALEELAAIVTAGKRRPGVVPVVEQQLFLHDFALHEGRLAAARAYCFETFGRALDQVTAGSVYTDQDYQRIRQASTLVTRAALEAVEFAYAWSGSKGMRQLHPLGRCMRDMHAATQHVYIDPSTLVNAAPALLASYAAR